MPQVVTDRGTDSRPLEQLPSMGARGLSCTLNLDTAGQTVKARIPGVEQKLAK